MTGQDGTAAGAAAHDAAAGGAADGGAPTASAAADGAAAGGAADDGAPAATAGADDAAAGGAADGGAPAATNVPRGVLQLMKKSAHGAKHVVFLRPYAYAPVSWFCLDKFFFGFTLKITGTTAVDPNPTRELSASTSNGQIRTSDPAIEQTQQEVRSSDQHPIAPTKKKERPSVRPSRKKETVSGHEQLAPPLNDRMLKWLMCLITIRRNKVRSLGLSPAVLAILFKVMVVPSQTAMQWKLTMMVPIPAPRCPSRVIKCKPRVVTNRPRTQLQPLPARRSQDRM